MANDDLIDVLRQLDALSAAQRARSARIAALEARIDQFFSDHSPRLNKRNKTFIGSVLSVLLKSSLGALQNQKRAG